MHGKSSHCVARPCEHQRALAMHSRPWRILNCCFALSANSSKNACDVQARRRNFCDRIKAH
eukprot:5453796-Karenia_brevis.AAC.1